METANILVGKNAKNKEIRCKLLNKQGQAIQARRGANLDTSLSDRGSGEWTFLQQSEVSTIVCDPSFKKAAVEEIRVVLSHPAAELGVTFALRNTGKREEKAVGGNDEFKEVALAAPAAVKDTLRCQVLDKQGKAITVQRGQNVDTTFADGGKGAWTFKLPAKSAAGKIVCDPAFAKGV